MHRGVETTTRRTNTIFVARADSASPVYTACVPAEMRGEHRKEAAQQNASGTRIKAKERTQKCRDETSATDQIKQSQDNGQPRNWRQRIRVKDAGTDVRETWREMYPKYEDDD